VTRQATIFQLSGDGLTRHAVAFPDGQPWAAVGRTSECDIQVTEAGFPQLGFQINWTADREPTLYIHPAQVFIAGEVAEATVKSPFFTLDGPVAIRMFDTETLFLVVKNAELPDSDALERLRAAGDAFERASRGAYVFRLGCLPSG
jgi:hypothetical protein